MATIEAATPPLDMEGALEVALGDEEFLKELLETYIADAEPAIANLSNAVEKGEADTVMKIAHSLKSASGNLKAAQMHLLAMQLEQMGRNGKLEGADELSAQLTHEFGRLREFTAPLLG